MKIKISNKNKFIRSMIVLLLILLSFMILSKSAFSHQEVEYKTIYISSGDSIWSICKNLIEDNDSLKKQSVKELIYRVQKINNLDSSEIYVGQKLLVPIN